MNSLGIAMKYVKPQKYYKNMFCLSKQNIHWSLFTAIQHQERLRGIKKKELKWYQVKKLDPNGAWKGRTGSLEIDAGCIFIVFQ